MPTKKKLSVNSKQAHLQSAPKHSETATDLPLPAFALYTLFLAGE